MKTLVTWLLALVLPVAAWGTEYRYRAVDYPGVFRLAMGTKSEQTVDAINALYQEIDHLIMDPGTPAEVQKAKDSILNSFIFNFEYPSQVLQRQIDY